MLVLKSVRAVEKFNVNGWLHKGSEQFKQYNHGCVKYIGSELSTVTIAPILGDPRCQSNLILDSTVSTPYTKHKHLNNNERIR